VPVPAATAQRDLADGIKLFQKGDFHAAIGKLGGVAESGAAGTDVQTMALRYLAFSYCVTKRRAQCQAQFEAALKLDPAFDLAPAERGHPLWGPVFERAKKTQHRPQK
jgi:hypothetical protein